MCTADEPSDEERQRDFERAKVIFEQNCEDFRSLNGFLWQIPIIVATLTGGLWFGVAQVGSDKFVQASLYFLAFAVNITFIVVLWRLRKGVMKRLLDEIHNYQGVPQTPGAFTVIWMFTILMALSGLISFAAFLPNISEFWQRIVETWDLIV